MIKGLRKNSTAVVWARKYVGGLKRPLTEDDITIAYREGMVYGQSSAWQRVDEFAPSTNCAPEEQIAVLFEVARHTYDIKVVRYSEFTECIGIRRDDRIPLYWAYLRKLLIKRVQIPFMHKTANKKDE